jgi:hypothetical protein
MSSMPFISFPLVFLFDPIDLDPLGNSLLG